MRQTAFLLALLLILTFMLPVRAEDVVRIQIPSISPAQAATEDTKGDLSVELPEAPEDATIELEPENRSTVHPDGTRSLLLTFTGDVTLGSEEAYRDRASSFESTQAREGDEYFFANFMDLFQNDDLTVINLEGVISDSPAGENKKKEFRFRGDPSLLNILKVSSIEACNLSNNHMQDYGSAGYDRTREELRKADIAYFGYRESYVFEKDGLRIAFFGIVSPKITSILPDAKKEIAQLKADGVNAVVFVFHMGTEYGKRRDKNQERYAREVIDAGADLVIMHHPHVLQGMDLYKNRTICYSLGNFCFGGNARIKNKSGKDTAITSEPLRTAAVQAEFTFDADGTYLGQQLTIYPAHISGTFPESNFQPVRVTGQEAENAMYLIQRDSGFTLNPYDPATGCAVQDYLPAN